MLEVKGLSCVRNEQVLFSEVDFHVGSGAALQISAANGTGKTSLLKTIAGLLEPNFGQIIWRNQNIRQNYPAFCSEILYLGHQANIHPLLTPTQNLQFLCALAAIQTDSKLLDAALDYMQLSKKKFTQCAELSAGQIQRLSMARLYITSAQLWILDEPFTNLDQSGKELVINLCMQHLRHGGCIVIATHQDFVLPNVEQHILFLENYLE